MFRTIYGEHKTEIIEKKSKFIAIIKNISSKKAAQDFILAQKKKFYDAKHIVYAYVLSKKEKKYSDNGEPSGTAGEPILKVLNQAQIFYAIIVVIRYFGGVLLGSNGLTRAYSSAASSVLKKATVLENNFYYKIETLVSYELFNKINRQLKKYDCFIDQIIYSTNIKLIFYVSEDHYNSLFDKINNIKPQAFSLADKNKKKVLGTIFDNKFIAASDDLEFYFS